MTGLAVDTLRKLDVMGVCRPSLRPRHPNRGQPPTGKSALYAPCEVLALRAAFTGWPAAKADGNRRRPTHDLNDIRRVAIDTVRADPERRWLVMIPAKSQAWTTDDPESPVRAMADGEVVTIVDLDALR